MAHPRSSNQRPRVQGYYWVKAGEYSDDPFEVAYWDGREWWTHGSEAPRDDEEFAFISSKKVRSFTAHS